MTHYFYIGRRPGCGCLVVSCADVPEWKVEVGKRVAEMIATGLVVERVTGEVMARDFRWDGCDHQVGQLQMELS